jgi:hypothetical protein
MYDEDHFRSSSYIVFARHPPAKQNSRLGFAFGTGLHVATRGVPLDKYPLERMLAAVSTTP